MVQFNNLEKISDFLWEIPQSFRADMRVSARIYATERMLKEIITDRSLEQLTNVATLPGIYKYAIAMPDIHEGYGFPVGGVAATNYPDGLISPGGIGYDINCGVRLLRSEYSYKELKDCIGKLTKRIFESVPSGVGRGGSVRLNNQELDSVLNQGIPYILEKGFGDKRDLDFIESNGRLDWSDAAFVSKTAKDRGRDQLGTIGAGNHFIEIDIVEQIFHREAAETFGLFENQITVLIHTGSRGLGHQVATDYIREMMSAMLKYQISLPDRELAGVPFEKPEGQNYFKAMAAAANFAWSNRQLITHWIRQAFKDILGESARLSIVYDVAHNIAKIEEYDNRRLIIHRKGATRAFGPDNPEVTENYRKIGQPVLIPGSMGTASYVLVGQKTSEETFGTTCHGAGRTMSRTKAKQKILGSELKKQLEERGIIIGAGSMSGLAEEAPFAYKDINSVVNVVDMAGIAKKVAKLRPVGVIKG